MADLVAYLAWLARNDWERWRALDPQGLQLRFKDWRQSADAIEQEQRRRGGVVKRIHLDPEEFARWCTETGVQPDYRARIQYAALLGHRRDLH